MGAFISFLCHCNCGTSDFVILVSDCAGQAQALVVERLGAYLETWSVGVHFKVRSLTAWQKSHFKRAGCRFCTAAGYHER